MNDSWLSRWPGPCTEGYECPFVSLDLKPREGETDVFYGIVGKQPDGCFQFANVSSARLGEIARDHLRSRHGVTDPLEATLEQSGHAVAIAAVACLMD